MHCIVTNDTVIVDFAKKRGAKVLNGKKIIVIKEDINSRSNESKKYISEKLIDNFFGDFYYVNMKTLGYKCVKYILQNNTNCTKNIEKTVYPMLVKKFNKKTRIIKQALTYFINNCRFNTRFGMPEEFKKFYDKHIPNKKQTNEERNFTFIEICREYLKKQA